MTYKVTYMEKKRNPLIEKGFHNMVDYAIVNTATFDERPFCEVDSLILCWLSYIYYHENIDINFRKEGQSVKDVFRSEYFAEMFDRVWSPKETWQLLAAVVASPRFRDMDIMYYRHEIAAQSNLQFAAMVFRLKPNLYYVAYRGTDWSITGWKEDFLLALKDPIPSQKMAVSYLTEVANAVKGSLILGGHSKGGNLAVYAAACCSEEIQNRIKRVYSFDGPGFLLTDLQQEGFKRIRTRIRKTMPGSSFFGMIFDSAAGYRIINSNGVSVMQHNPITWQVKNGKLVERDDRTMYTKTITRRLNIWIKKMSQDELEVFIRTVFDLADQTGATSIDELRAKLAPNVVKIFRSYRNLDKERQKFIRQIISMLAFGGDDDYEVQAKKLKAKIAESEDGSALLDSDMDDDDFLLFIK